ncbi:MAG: hypothetical protein Q4E91_12345 [Lachnospiraceae bacterium]|nr:hypothetical protein [Lachnospiraceae bacterium]
MLKRNGFLYAVYFLYRNKDLWNVLNGTILSRIKEIAPPVTALIPHPSCPVRIQESVYRYVLAVRKKQRDPTILLDAKYDNMYVDGVISENSCLAWFDAAGQLHSYDKKYESAEYNMFQNELQHIFKLAFPKDSEEKGDGTQGK